MANEIPDSSRQEPQPSNTGKTKTGGLTWIYGSAVFVGILVIFMIRGSIHQSWGLLALVMAIYFVVGHEKAKREGMIFEFSDSFYYLGFTLTLVALLQTFLPLTAQTKDAEVFREPIKMLGYFGAGLITTVIGVVGRTMLQIFYRTAQENIQSVNEEIERVSREYLSNLHAVNEKSKTILSTSLATLDGELKQGLVSIQNTLSDYSKRLQVTAESVSTLAIDTSGLQSSLNGMVVHIEGASTLLRSQVDELHRVCGEYLRGVSSASTNTLSAMDEFRGGVVGIQKTFEATGESVARLGDLVNQVSVERMMTEISAATTQIGNISRVLEKASNDLNRGGLAELGQALAQITSHVREIDKVLEEISTAIKVKLDQI